MSHGLQGTVRFFRSDRTNHTHAHELKPILLLKLQKETLKYILSAMAVTGLINARFSRQALHIFKV